MLFTDHKASQKSKLKGYLAAVAISFFTGLPTIVWAGPVVVDASGNVLGLLIADRQVGSISAIYTALNEKGYRVRVMDLHENPDNVASLLPTSFSYQTEDCTGAPFVTETEAWNGVVFLAPAGNDPMPLVLWYTSPNERPVNRDNRELLSVRYFNDWECRTYSSQQYTQPPPSASVKAFPNDAKKTGVNQPEWPSPLQIKHPNDPDVTGCLFNDRFQACQ